MKKSLVIGIFLLSLLLVMPLTSAGILEWLGITGKVTDNASDGENEIIEPVLECIDTDNGKDYYVVGSVSAGAEGEPWTIPIPDICVDEFILEEGYCENGNMLFENYECAHGCKDGACIEKTESEEIICCKIEAVVPEPVPKYENRQKSECPPDELEEGTTYEIVSDKDCVPEIPVEQCGEHAECLSEEKRYCEDSNACIEITNYECMDGKCVATGGGGGCSPCPNGCEDGACMVGEQKPINLIYFYADVCPSCFGMEDEVDKVSEKLNIGLAKINTDAIEHAHLVEKYGIKAVPTLIFIQNIKENKYLKKEGKANQEEIINWIESPKERPEPRPEPEEPPYEVETCAAKIKITLDKDVYYYGDYVKVKVEIVDAEGNGLMAYPFRSRIFTYGDGLWHTGESSETGEDGLFINNDGKIEKGRQQPGKIKLKVTTAPNIKGCGPVEDSVELEVRKGGDTEEVCGIGVCVPEEDERPKDIPKDRGLYACMGCELEGKCYPISYRKAGQYCTPDNEFVNQIEDGECDNNFECKANVCIGGECVGEGLIKRIINFFKKMFGGDEDEEPKPEVDCSKLLIEKDIGEYEYFKSEYGHAKESQVPLYSEDGEQIGIVKCCVSGYYRNEEPGGMVLVCPFDSRKDIENSLKWLSARGELSLEEYKGEEVYGISNGKGKVWTHKDFILAVGIDPKADIQFPEEIMDTYLKEYKNDLDISEIPKPEPVDPAKKFLDEAKKIGEVTLIDFETTAAGITLQNEDRVDGDEWKSLGVVFEAPSEEYMKAFGPLHPFYPLDKISLSPGTGPYEPVSNDDDLNIIFSEPVKAAGLYLLDLGDTDERESITFLDKDGNVIKKISPWPKSTFGNPAPGTFVGLVHEGIAKIEILENTQDGDDIAYDNLYFVK